MDYKELIDILQDETNPNVLDYIDDAVTAINDLIARTKKRKGKGMRRSKCSEKSNGAMGAKILEDCKGAESVLWLLAIRRTICMFLEKGRNKRETVDKQTKLGGSEKRLKA